ncbi:hypothetical protein [Biostraticola tofi]|uniref:Uncharacterized protein n=1 Tax=Biostraticola tofi TaxID=466109 RepID=A0A4R3Z2Z2_9GAMM|nr:hypothetical protein [Biostraticola tofi]TCW00154.1 hypothetical protein EDC52_101501 [Biostraticola tofi]
MPVHFSSLPEPLAEPARPLKSRWLGLSAVLLLVLFGLGRWFPLRQAVGEAWFLLLTVVFPLLIGLVFYGIRLWIYENRREYVLQWNETRQDTEAKLIAQGQRTLGVLSLSYHTAVANNKLADALLQGAVGLQPVYFPTDERVAHFSQLAPPPVKQTQEEYVSRLSLHLQQVLSALDHEYLIQPCALRVRHDQTLSDDALLERLCAWLAEQQLPFGEVSLDNQADGLLWLDDWLDNDAANPLVLSIEIQLNQLPVADIAESVSAVLLAKSSWCRRHAVTPLALVHRPVALSSVAAQVDELLVCSAATGPEPLFLWQTRCEQPPYVEAISALDARGFDVAARQHRLDSSLGLLANGTGNLTLACAVEHLRSSSLAQLILLTDLSLQGCLVRAIPELPQDKQ